MAEVHYLISDASKQVDVESHVLRYWEDELELNIPRNDMGHRYYTEYHIHLFRKIKELKEKGYQLKAIKSALNKMAGAMGEITITEDYMEEDMKAAWNEGPSREQSRLRSAETARVQSKNRPAEMIREQSGSRAAEPEKEQTRLRPGGDPGAGQSDRTLKTPVREPKGRMAEGTSAQPPVRGREQGQAQPSVRGGEQGQAQSLSRGGEPGGGVPSVHPGESKRGLSEERSLEAARQRPSEHASEPEQGQAAVRSIESGKGSLPVRSADGIHKQAQGRGGETGQPQNREQETAREQLKVRLLEGTRQQEETSRQQQEHMPQKVQTSELSPEKINAEKMARFQSVMNHIIGRAMDANLDRLAREVSNTVSEDVTDKVMKEVEYLLRVSDEKEEERFRQLDETIRAYQRQGKGRAEAAAARVPFFKKKKFGKSGKKMF